MSLTAVLSDIKEPPFHYPVMHQEVFDLLDVRNKKVIVDCTLGLGSHALNFLKVMSDDAVLIGIDKDDEALAIAQERCQMYQKKIIFVKGDFCQLDSIMNSLQIKNVDAFFFDLGVSMYQLTKAERGFSFLKEGPLDMRMDKESFFCAYDLVNNLSEEELSNIFRQFGEERYAKRIARFIVCGREKKNISTTSELVQIIFKAVPSQIRQFRLHPAARVFQALRIAVNHELDALHGGLKTAISFLNKGGRVGVISFHSLEDRIVKHLLRDCTAQGIVKCINKKPLTPHDDEMKENNASRSAKLRVAEKI